MVIRRIRKHVATHNWFAVGIDFLIVVAGIVIGTQVNNWNQGRIERNQGKEYRERLIADIRSNEIEMLDRRAYFVTVRKHAESALAALDRPAMESGAAFVVDAYQASQIVPRTPKRFTYEELVSTGRFGQVGDAKLRDQIAHYYVRLDTVDATMLFVPPYREHIRSLMPNAAQQAVRAQCAEAVHYISDGQPLAHLPENCSIKLDPADVADAVASVRASSEIPAELTRLMADLDVKIWLVDSLLVHARQVREIIKKKKKPTSA